MQRTIVQPADVSEAALADLKSWLGITRTGEDAVLADLIRSSFELFESFAGQYPLEQTVEEFLPTFAGRSTLTSRPVRELVSIELIAPDGSRSLLASDDFVFSIDHQGCASVAISAPLDGQAIGIRIVAGIAANWSALPSALKQGVIRMAAFQYRDRDFETDAGSKAGPPMSVAALWRPWRSIRLT